MKTKTGRFILEPVIEDGKHAVRQAEGDEYFKYLDMVIPYAEFHLIGFYPIYRLIEEEEEWKPKEGDGYYMPNINFADLTAEGRSFIAGNMEITERRVSEGFVFKTKEEAIKKAEEIISLIKNNN